MIQLWSETSDAGSTTSATSASWASAVASAAGSASCGVPELPIDINDMGTIDDRWPFGYTILYLSSYFLVYFYTIYSASTCFFSMPPPTGFILKQVKATHLSCSASSSSCHQSMATWLWKNMKHPRLASQIWIARLSHEACKGFSRLMGGLGLRFQDHFPDGSAEDEGELIQHRQIKKAFAAAMPEATAPACFATRKRGQFAKFHIVGPAEEADASKSPHAPRGCAEASAWATCIWLMKGNAPASFWNHKYTSAVGWCKNVMEQSVCSLSIVLHIQHDVAVHWGIKIKNGQRSWCLFSRIQIILLVPNKKYTQAKQTVKQAPCKLQSLPSFGSGHRNPS